MIQGIKRRDFLAYTLLPGLGQRMARLFSSGFGHVAYFMALVYQGVRLLPPGHPYTRPVNIGRFGLRHVIAEAANNLTFSRKNLDQIVLFATILIGLGLVLLQIGLLFVSLFFQSAMAQMPTSFGGFFVTPAASAPNDLAYIMLDLVFGVPDIFNSCVSTGADCLLDIDAVDTGANTPTGDGLNDPWAIAALGYPFPIHHAMHQMFQLYSIGLLVVAALLTIYFIFTIVAETAQTGTPFGKRYNKIWAPIRLVVAFGLLIPVGYGLNSSQYIVLYAAKYGSGFATNGWTLFNRTLLNSYGANYKNMLADGSGADATSLVSQPNVPEVGTLLQFMYVARTCAELYKLKENSNAEIIRPYLVKDALAANSAVEVAEGTTYQSMINFIEGADRAIIRFGIQNDELYPSYKGHVAPFCGELAIPLSDPRDPRASDTRQRPDRGAEIMQRYYFFVIKELWFDVYSDSSSYGDPPFAYYTSIQFTQWSSDPLAFLPDSEWRAELQDFYRNDLNAAMNDPGSADLDLYDPGIGSLGAIREQVNSGRWSVSPTLRQKGWAGAGLWYNKVAQLNGAVSTAVLGIPMPTRYPEIMEYVLARKQQQDQFVPADTRYEPILAGGNDVPTKNPADQQMAQAMWQAFKYWQEGGQTSTTHTAITNNVFIDTVNAIFGTDGLFSMRKNDNIHPMAKLVGVGRSLVESSIRNIGLAMAGGLAAGILDGMPASVAAALSSSLVTIAMITLTAGFMLYYVIPFLPFIYFFFAVSGWIKAIFEAMVGAPLWALAHIRIDGDGLPGQAAVSGYALIFEIFLRPIVTVFGLLASITIFSAFVATLNEVWDVVRANLSGFDVGTEVSGGGGPSQLGFFRNAVDEFFFTIIYTVVVYMLGMSCFKLIDQIPENILRWMGQSVSPFGRDEDPAQGLVGTTTVGMQQTLQELGGGLQKSIGAAKNF